MTEERIREAVRYLGYGNHTVDERTLALITDSFRELEEKARVKSVCRIFEVHREPEGQLRIGNMNIESKSLARNLSGCREAALFAATLGTEVDLLMKRYQVTDMARAVIWQACAAAYLEEYCDQMQEQLGREWKEGRASSALRLSSDAKSCGICLKPRFSPGYGDFDIHHQEDILRLLDAPKTIGLTMTESYMLTPVKSVTAVIGIVEEEAPGEDEAEKNGVSARAGEGVANSDADSAEAADRWNRCAECGKQDCRYRSISDREILDSSIEK